MNLNYSIIVAGGSGCRMGSSIPKQFLSIEGLPILMHTITRFMQFDPKIKVIVVLPESQIDYWEGLCVQHNFSAAKNIKVVRGGENRFSSVKNGLAAIEGNDGLVAIHDGVRPFVSIETIKRCFNMASQKGNAIPVIPINDSLRMVDGTTNKAVDRNAFVSIQTPQVFAVKDIKRAYSVDFDSAFTDDASVFEKMGKNINLVDGNIENIKITHQIDLLIAEAILKSEF